MRLYLGSLLALAALPSCSNAIKTPTGAVILSGSAATGVLNQCSRWAPQKGEATWRPTAAEIDDMEARIARELPNKLRTDAPDELTSFPAFPRAFTRQYVGIVRRGHRFIYGNYAPGASGSEDETKPIVVCDGGPRLFGVEYDPASKQLTGWGFNGVA